MIMEINLKLPKRWSALTSDQVIKVARLMLHKREKPDFLVHCLLLLSGWKIVKWRMLVDGNRNYFYFKNPEKKVFCIGADVVANVVKTLEWILEEVTMLNFCPELKGRRTPNFMLYNISLKQYLLADNYYRGYVETNQWPELCRMAAVLYCHDPEVIDIEQESKRIMKMDEAQVYSVFIWFSGVKNWLRDQYPWIFVNSTDGSEFVAPAEVLLSMVSSLNGGDITRNKNVLNTMVHEALYELNLKIENSKKK